MFEIYYYIFQSWRPKASDLDIRDQHEASLHFLQISLKYLSFLFLLLSLLLPGSRAEAAGIDFAQPATAGVYGGITSVINGTGFTGTTSVAFGNVTVSPSNWTVLSDTQIRVAVPPSEQALDGNCDIIVWKGTTKLIATSAFVYTRVDPVIADIQPRSTGVVGGSTLTITGSALKFVQSVSFNGVEANLSSIQATDTSVSVKVPGSVNYASGPVTVAIRTNYGLTSNSTLLSYFQNNPTVSGVSPASGGVNGGTIVTITGQRLTGAVGVRFGTVSADPSTITVVSDSEIRVRASASATQSASTVDVTVFTTTGFDTATAAYSYTVSNPTVSAISPNTVPAFGGGTATITGTGLSQTLDVKFGTVSVDPASISILSDQQITVTIPQSPNNAAGTVVLTVVTQTGQATLPGGFTYTRQDPVITGISPSTGGPYGGYPITITGVNLRDVTTVVFGSWVLNSSFFTLQADGSLKVNLPTVGITAIPNSSPRANFAVTSFGTIDVTVKSATGFNTRTSGFTFAKRVDPVVTSFSPTSGSEIGNTDVVIKGTNFENLLGVKFAGTWATVTSATPTEIRVKTNPRGAGVVGMSVQTQLGYTNAPGSYTYIAMPPAPLTYNFAVYGTTAASTAGNTDIVIDGSFLSNATVTIGGVPATILWTTYSSIGCTAPVNPVGVHTIVVSNSSASVSPMYKPTITYVSQAPATLSAIAPASGSILGGTRVTFTGTNLQGAKVFFGVSPATVVANPSDGLSLTVIAPAHTLGPVDVDVTTQAGTATLWAGYQYVNPPAPVITQVTPQGGWTTGGNTVALAGQNLLGSTVTIDDVAVSQLQINDDTKMTFVIPPHAAGTAVLKVVTPGGQATTNFTYSPPPFTITGISPSTSSTLGGTRVTITGTNLDGVNVLFREEQTGVTASDVVATNVVVAAGNTSLTALTPPRPTPGPVSVLVNKNNTTVALAGQFTYVMPVPVVSAITPSQGTAAGGTSVAITGDNLANAVVKFGAATASPGTLSADGRTLTVRTPVGTVGPVDVTVTTLGGSVVRTGGFTYLTPMPEVWSKDILSGTVNGGTTMTITGRWLTGATATVGGVAATNVAVVAGGGSMTLKTPPGVPGPVDVSVTTPGGTATLFEKYTYLTERAIISTVSPTSAVNDSAATITLTGQYLWGARVYFGSVEALPVTVAPDGRSLTTTLPYRLPGKADITVATSFATPTVLADGFTYLPPRPTLTNISPTTGPLAGTTITLTGTSFTTGSTVSFGSTVVTPTNIASDGKTLTVTAPSSASAGTVQVSVTTPVGTTASQSFTYMRAPVISSLSATEGPLTGNTTVDIIGTDFTGTVSVTIGGTAVSGFQVLDNGTRIRLTTPAGTAGNVPVRVTTPGGVSTGSASFTYVAAPVLSSITPAIGPQAGGQSVTLAGTGLDRLVSLTIGGRAVTPVSNTGTSLVFVTPAATAEGSVTIDLVTSGGAVSGGYTYVAAPQISGLNPAAGSFAGGSVTISGSGLFLADQVTFGSTVVTISGRAPNGSSLTVMAPSTTVAGAVSVKVRSPGGIATSSYTYVSGPTIASLTPAEGPEAGQNIVRIGGSSLAATTSVTFGSANATIVAGSVTASGFDVTVPPGQGAVQVTATSSGGSSNSLTYTYRAVPVLASVSPALLPLSGGVLTLGGSGFAPGTRVTIGSQTVTASSVAGDGSSLTVKAPAGVAGSASVSVATAGGSSQALSVRYVSEPAVTGLSATQGPLTGQTAVDILGSNFFGSVTVKFGGVPATVVSVETDGSRIRVLSPLGAAGDATVTVTAAGGSANSPVRFTYVPIPVINSLTPAEGPQAGGQTVRLSGSGLSAVTSVTFGGVSASIVAGSATANSIDVITPQGHGAVSVVATSVGGTSSGIAYDYRAVPTLASVSPDMLPLSGGALTVQGSGFTAASQVLLDGQTLVPSQVSTTSLSVTAPSRSAGNVTLSVTTAGGTSTSLPVTYVGAPVVTGLSVTQGPLGGMTAVDIAGSNFFGAISVTVNGAAASGVSASSDGTVIHMLTPAGTAGPAVVRVTAVGGSVDSPVRFTYVRTPQILSVSPAEGPQAGGQTVHVAGTSLLTVTSVQFGAANASIVANSVTDTGFDVIVPPGTGAVPLTVTSPGGNFTGGTYSYLAGPQITALSPAAGSAAGGYEMQIQGQALVSAAGVPGTVRVGGVAVPVTAAAPDGSWLKLVMPAHAAGKVAVTVDTPGGTATSGTGFDYVGVPVLLAISPSESPLAGGGAVTLIGDNFRPDAVVTIGGAPAPISEYRNAQAMLVAAPAHPSGEALVSVKISTPGGQVELPQAFSYVAAMEATPPAGALKNGISGRAYEQTLSLSYASAPLTFTLAGGALPGGLSLDAATGTISGTIDGAVTGTFSFVIQVADARGKRLTLPYAISVNSAELVIPARSITFGPGEPPVSVDLTEGVSGGPFASAAVISIDPPHAGTAIVTPVNKAIKTGSLRPAEGAPAEETADATAASATKRSALDGMTADDAETTTTETLDVAVAEQIGMASPEAVEAATSSAALSRLLMRAAPSAPAPLVGETNPALAAAAGGAGTIIDGFMLDFVPASGFRGTAVVHYKLTSSTGGTGVGTVTYVFTVDGAAVIADAGAAARDFIDHRQSLLGSVLETPGLMDRRSAPVEKAGRVTLTPSDSGLESGFNYDRQLGDDDVHPVTVWTRMSGTLFQRSGADATGKPADWGTFALFAAGVDYKLSDRLLMGVTFDLHRLNDPLDGITFATGHGWLAGPYASLQLIDGVYLDGAVLYGQTSNALDNDIFSGDFQSEMTLARAVLRGDFEIGGFTASPSLAVSYSKEAVDDFVVGSIDGKALPVSGFSRSQLRGTIGLDLTTSMMIRNSLTVTPTVGVAGGFAGLDGAGMFGSVKAGARVGTRGGWNFDTTVTLDASAGQKSVGVRGGISRRF